LIRGVKHGQVNRGTVVQQQLHTLLVAILDSEKQRSAPSSPLLVDFNIGVFKHYPQHGSVATLSCAT
jgi:hypothetical protein